MNSGISRTFFGLVFVLCPWQSLTHPQPPRGPSESQPLRIPATGIPATRIPATRIPATCTHRRSYGPTPKVTDSSPRCPPSG